jgi:hypothetical protein
MGQIFSPYAGQQAYTLRAYVILPCTGRDGKRVGAQPCRRSMVTTQVARGRSPLKVPRRMGPTTLTLTNHAACLTGPHVQKSPEKYSHHC